MRMFNRILRLITMFKADAPKLEAVTTSIVELKGEISLYYFNNLTYLFEYFFIKNFGCRYMNGLFIKQPNGPVISNYKQLIKTLVKKKLIQTDLDMLFQKHQDDNSLSIRVNIRAGAEIHNHQPLEPIVLDLLEQIVDKYGNLTIEDLKQLVEKTYTKQQDAYNGITAGAAIGSTGLMSMFGNLFGGIVGGVVGALASYPPSICDPTLILRESSEKNGLRLYWEHSQQYPNTDAELQEKNKQEMRFFEALRPAI